MHLMMSATVPLQAILPHANVQTKVRFDSSTQRASVFDIISACNLCRNAREAYANVQRVHSTQLQCLEVQPMRFAGKNQVPTPAIHVDNIPTFLPLFLASARIPLERKKLLLNGEAPPLKQYAEIEIHSCLCKAFAHLRHVPQASVGMYLCDLLFVSQPGLKQPLVIECDERGHKAYNADKEAERERYITDRLGCRWLRYDPYKPGFDIYDLISQVSVAMAECNAT